MGRAKCRICGKALDTKTAYKVSDGTKNKYYCTSQEYTDLLLDNCFRDKCYNIFLKEVMNYNDNQFLPPILVKKLKQLRDFYSYDVIYETIVAKIDDLKYWANIENKFNNEYAKASYLSTIIANSINDIYIAKMKREASLQKVKSSSIDLDVLESFNDFEPAQISNTKDISSFLD